MKTHAIERNVQTRGVREASAATIKASQQAFDILSNRLYADKIRAVLREYATNAYDSHVAAGKKDVPFDVKLPTVLDPSFRIRDYGTGLSHDDVMTLYNTYFDSTKTATNDAVGALGLGSKSAYSYTTAFSVVSFFEGKKRVYNCGVGADGIPGCSFMAESDTDEPNGLEISFAVKKSDFSEFRRKAGIVFRRFNPLPNLAGDSLDYEAELGKVLLEGKDWRVRDSKGYYSRSQVAIMGLIEYPINVSSLTDYRNDEQALVLRTKENLSLFEDLDIEIDFNIGDLDIAASREELGYNPQTRDFLVSIINRVVEDVIKTLSTQIQKAPNFLQACKIYADLPLVTNRLESRSEKILYKGKEVSGTIEIKIPYLLDKSDYCKDENSSQVDPEKIRKLFIEVEKYECSRYSDPKRIKPRHRTYGFSSPFRFSARSSFAIVLRDAQVTRPNSRILHFMKQNGIEHVHLMTFANSKMRKNFIDYIGDKSKFFKLSELEAPPREPRSKSAGSEAPAFYAFSTKGRTRGAKSRFWTKTDASSQTFSHDTTYYYIPLKRNEVALDGWDNEKLNEIMFPLELIGQGFILYGVGSSFMSNLKKLDGNWELATTYLDKKVKELLEEDGFKAKLSNDEIKDFIASQFRTTMSISSIDAFRDRLADIIEDLGKDCDPLFKKLEKTLKSVFDVSTSASSRNVAIVNMALKLSLNVETNVQKQKDDFNEIMEQLDNKYKVLGQLGFLTSSWNKAYDPNYKKQRKEVVEFIKMVNDSESG